jgi:8-oxo-dGTP diphosphatase
MKRVPRVKAAGGVVWRRGAKGHLEILVIHRPRYDDWTFPKGKLESGESHRSAARREVREETGLRARLGPKLVATNYRDQFGRPKTVRYWAMTVQGGSFEPNEEVDEVAWLSAKRAAKRLTYSFDQAVLVSLLDVLAEHS